MTKPPEEAPLADSPQDFRVVLQGIPESEREKALAAGAFLGVFQGPLPPPSMLKSYEEAAPGSAMKIIERAEAGQQRWFRLAVLREVFAFFIVLAALLTGAYLIVQDRPVAGGFLFASLFGCAALYIRGHFRARRNSGNGKQ